MNYITQSDIDFIDEIIDSIKIDRQSMLPSEYCESVRYLPKELTPRSGYYDYNYTPYLREIVDNFSPLSPIREVAFQKSAQIGATTGLLEAIILYFMGHVPRTQIYVSADKELAKKGMTTKIDRMLDQSGLMNILGPQTSRKSNKSGNTDSEKEYPGGFLHAIGAQSPGKMRQMNYQVGVVDELDGMPDKFKNEGDVLDLLTNRIIVPYESSCKILYISTPAIEQTSKIIQLYNQGDQRNYYVPCKHCGEMIVLHWHLKENQTTTGDVAGIIFKQTESGKLIHESVFYKCQNCGKLMVNDDKSIILIEGKWKPTAETKKEYFRSYWLNALYSPVGMFSWAGVVERFIPSWDFKRNKVKNIEKYQSFRNTQQGLGFEILGEAPKYERVIQHQRKYQSNEIPNRLCIEDNGYPILLLVCSCDVHRYRIDVDIKGYTVDGRNYTIAYFPIAADKETTDKKDPCWLKLADVIETQEWKADDGKLYRIRITFIDAAYGESTNAVYSFCADYSFGVYPIFGEQWITGEGKGITFTQASKKTIEKAGCLVYKINTTITKNRIAKSFRSDWNQGEEQPAWKPNFPADLRDDYFRMFEAEYKAPKVEPATGRILGYYWHQIDGRDNHAFDTAGYNIAALECLAEYVCTQRLGLDSLNWNEFWNYAVEGNYYETSNGT